VALMRSFFLQANAIANGTLERAYQRFPFPNESLRSKKNKGPQRLGCLESILNAKLITSDHTVLFGECDA